MERRQKVVFRYPGGKVDTNRPQKRRFIRRILWGIFGGVLFGLLATFGVGFYTWQTWIVNGDLPDVNIIGAERPNITTKVLDRSGQEIGEILVERRVVLPLEEMPKVLVQAVVVAEDARFWEHAGVDYWAIISAFRDGLKTGHFRGASTITQQVIKDQLFRKQKRTLRVKAQEAHLARQLEKRWSKQQILGFYLNQIEVGNRRYGVEEAAQYYFGKSVRAVTLAEAALLASLPKAQEDYSKNLGRWKKRQRYVLRQMERYGWVSPASAAQAAAEPIVLAKNSIDQSLAPEFVNEVERELKLQHGNDLGRLGLTVYTTADISLQMAAREALHRGLDAIDAKNRRKSRPQGAIIVLDSRTREVLAMVGGYEYKRGDGFNRALDAKRQPGSTFKTMVWAAAFEADFADPITASTVFPDIEKTYVIPGSPPWTPKNHGDHPSLGEEVTMRQAFSRSLNTISAQVTEEVGSEAVVQMSQRLGIKSELRRPLGKNGALIAPLSIALGTSEVTLAELTNAYAVFADRGRARDPSFILKIGAHTKPLPEVTEMISPALAHLMTSLLTSVVQEGTAIRAKGKLPHDMAGKTGTSQSEKDAWFIGYAADLVVGVWVGYDKGDPMGSNWQGSRAALPIWIDFMRATTGYLPRQTFPDPPAGLVVQDGELYLEGNLPYLDPFADWNTEEENPAAQNAPVE
ncbi:MAG: transglycosylase domain-containing protein [bacterium]|nr:transglycosylase domain-containing protein [bacterium]